MLPDGFKYCTFLSHFKVEAGSDARYLSDLIRRMTGQPAYLDSTDLVDLRTLFNEGVHKTDVLVILATKGVFTRPWCLMEMWEAATHQVPIVLFPVVGGGFELADAVHLLSDLATQMPARNPTCLAEVMEHVEKHYGVTDVREVARAAADTPGRAGRGASRRAALNGVARDSPGLVRHGVGVLTSAIAARVESKQVNGGGSAKQRQPGHSAVTVGILLCPELTELS